MRGDRRVAAGGNAFARPIVGISFGNGKRTALFITLLFLSVTGCSLRCESSFVDMTVDAAAGGTLEQNCRSLTCPETLIPATLRFGWVTACAART